MSEKPLTEENSGERMKFIKSNFDAISKIYIKEKLQQGYGVVMMDWSGVTSDDDKVNVFYLPLSSMAEPMKNDIINKFKQKSEQIDDIIYIYSYDKENSELIEIINKKVEK
jgi:hypothetical protein